VGLTVESELVEVLLDELSQGTGDLPLLEFVLQQVWEQRQPGNLKLQIYQQQIGGLRGALERKAQAVYEGLDADAQACARWVFLSLTQLGEGTEDTRRRVLKSELVVAKYPTDLVERTLQALTAAKLVVVGSEEQESRRAGEMGSRGAEEMGGRGDGEGEGDGGDREQLTANSQQLTQNLKLKTQNSASSSFILHPSSFPLVTVEVAHEILIRHWSTLRWWLEENRSRLRSQRQIEQAAQQWKQGGKQSDFLLRGVRLDAAEELYVKYTDELSRDVQEFIEACIEQRSQEEEQTRRRLKRAQLAIALISGLGIITTTLGGAAYLQRQQAQLNEIRALNALSESQFLSNHQLEALTTSVQAAELLERLNGWGISTETLSDVRTQTIATLQQAVEETQESNRLEGHSQRVNRVSIRADGQMMASASDDGTVRLWQPDGTLIASLDNQPNRMTAVAFSPDGKTLATASNHGVQLWDAMNQSKLQSMAEGTWITDVAWSTEGKVLAIASRNQTIQLVNPTNGAVLRTLTGQTGWVNQVSFSPDGQLLASASENGTVRLWSVVSGSPVRTLSGHQGRVSSVAFSPDGQRLASAGEDGVVRLWAIADGAVQTLEGHTDRVNSVQFSHDGHYLVSASVDHTLRLWSVPDGELLKTIHGQGSEVLDAVFSPDGQMVMSAGADKSVRLWDIREINQQPVSAFVATISPNHTTFAAAGWDGTIQIGSIDRSTETRSFPPQTQPIAALSFSPDGQLLASGSDDTTIQLWNANNGTVMRSLTGHQGKITSLSFNAADNLLASGSEDKTIRLWNPTNGALVVTLTGHSDGVSSVAFSPDGQLLASGSYDNTVKLWRSPDGTLLRTLTGHRLGISAIAFSPNGKTLAVASWDNTITLWRVSDATLLNTLNGHQDGVTSLAFSTDGNTLISGSADQTIKLWNAQTGMLLKTLLGQPDTVRTVSLSTDGKTLISASEAGGVLVWDLNLEDLLERGCDRLHPYLKHNPNVDSSDQTLCTS
jgi:WD40 repeat protein